MPLMALVMCPVSTWVSRSARTCLATHTKMFFEKRIIGLAGSPDVFGNVGDVPNGSPEAYDTRCETTGALEFQTYPNVMMTLRDYFAAKYQHEVEAGRADEAYAHNVLGYAQYYEMRLQQALAVRNIEETYRQFLEQGDEVGLIQPDAQEEQMLANAGEYLRGLMRRLVANFDTYCNPQAEELPTRDEHSSVMVELRTAMNEYEMTLRNKYQNQAIAMIKKWGDNFDTVESYTLRRQGKFVSATYADLLSRNVSLLSANIMATAFPDSSADTSSVYAATEQERNTAEQQVNLSEQRRLLLEQFDVAVEHLSEITGQHELDADTWLWSQFDWVLIAATPGERASFLQVFRAYQHEHKDIILTFSQVLHTLSTSIRERLENPTPENLQYVRDFLQQEFEPLLQQVVQAKIDFVADLVDAGLSRKSAYEWLQGWKDLFIALLFFGAVETASLFTPKRVNQRARMPFTATRLSKAVAARIGLATYFISTTTADPAEDMIDPLGNIATIEQYAHFLEMREE